MNCRIGVVGAGFGARVHVPAFRSDPRATVTALCASTQAKADAIGRDLDIPAAYGSWERLVASPDVDIVALAVPPLLQATIIPVALACGKPVFAEKPLAASLGEATVVVGAVRASGLPVVVDFNFAELPEFLQARDLLAEVGSIRRVSVLWSTESRVNADRSEHWKASLESGGGTLANFGSHVLYYLEWFLGPVSRMQAHLAAIPGDPRSGDAFATLALEFRNGTSGSVSISAASYAGSGHLIEFSGEHGTVRLANPSADPMHGFTVTSSVRGYDQRVYEGGRNSWPQDSRVVPTARLVRRFLDWVLLDTPSGPTVAQALRVQELLKCAYASARDGQRYDVEAGVAA